MIIALWAGCWMAAGAQQAFTQRLQQSRQGEGKVSVSHSKAIDELVNGPQATAPAKPAAQPQQTAATTPQQTDKKTTTISQNTPQTTTPGNTLKPDSGTAPKNAIAAQPQQTDTAIVPDDNRKKVIKGGYKINGYRVQVFAGSNSRSSRVQAERIGKEINALFPGEPVYVHFYSPRWICRMGNYRTYEQAHEVLRAVKKMGYGSAIIVKGKITVPYQSAPALTTP